MPEQLIVDLGETLAQYTVNIWFELDISDI